MIDVSFHHTCLAERRVRSTEHMLGHVFSVLTPGFDFDHPAVKILQVVVHFFEIGSARLLARHRRPMARKKLPIVAFEERLQGRQPIRNIAKERHRVDFRVEQVAGDENFLLFEINRRIAFAVAVAVLGAIFQMQVTPGRTIFIESRKTTSGNVKQRSGKRS